MIVAMSPKRSPAERPRCTISKRSDREPMITLREYGAQRDQVAVHRDDLEVALAVLAIDRNAGSPARVEKKPALDARHV
jgi:hypothetical protein